MKKARERDGRGSPIPPLLQQLEGVDLLAAAAAWYAGSRLPACPTLTGKEIAVLWLRAQDLSGLEIGNLMNLSYQRVSFLERKAIRKMQKSVAAR